MTFSNICAVYCGNNAANVVFRVVNRFGLIGVALLHIPTENSIAALNRTILEANSRVRKVKLCGYQTFPSQIHYY